MDLCFSPHSARSEDVLAQTLHDPMFEPHSSFSLANSEAHRGLHDTLGSRQAPNTQAIFKPVMIPYKLVSRPENILERGADISLYQF
jgi:hypothetical protein